MDAVADNAGSPPLTLGRTLAAERERQGLSRADVAQRLHMSAYQVEALENGDFGRLPQGTFLRGFVRNYAKVLAISPNDLLAMLGDRAAPAKRPGIVVPDESIRFDPAGERLNNPYVKATGIAFVMIALGFAAMYWWLFVRPSPPATTVQRPSSPAVTQASPPAPVAMSPSPAAAQTAPAMASPAMTPAPTPVMPSTSSAAVLPKPPAMAPASAQAPAKAAVAPPAPPTPAATDAKKANEPTLKFVFKGPSWVEVRDAKGRLLLSRLNAPGTDAEVSGKPPFDVVVGNAPEVQLYYNDHEFDLEPHTKVAVARFTVE